MNRRALPTDFRFRDFADNDSVMRGTHDVAHSTFVENLRLRRPELFAEEEVTFTAQAPVAGGQADTSTPFAAAVQAPVHAPTPLPTTGFVVEFEPEFTETFGGIASPPSHDFPI